MESEQNVIQHLVRQHLEDLHRAGVRQLPASDWVPDDAGSAASTGEPAVAKGAVAGKGGGASGLTDGLTSDGLTNESSSSAAEGSSARRPNESTSNEPTGTEQHPTKLSAAGERPSVPSAKPRKPLSGSARLELLEGVNARVQACQKCSELCSTRTQTVFGVGNPAARLVFLGEAPGADEDRLGEPFVGKAGQLLDKIIEACTLSRADVYILNILKCRPPGNRNPTDSESANCDEFLQAQLDIIQPEYICCLGSVAAKTLLDTQTTIGRLRGKFHDWRGIQVLATYHPAYLLRNPSAKADVWKDMQFLMKEMGIALPKRGK